MIVSAVLSRRGTPAKLLRVWLEGAYELVVSPRLLDELARVLRYPKISRSVTRGEADELVGLLRRQALVLDDPGEPPLVSSPDPDDDHLISLAASAQAVIVSGDAHLQSLASRIPVYSPAGFLTLLPAEDH